MAKILFLDIDGVCNSAAFARQGKQGGILGIDPVAAARVKRIIKETGCKVVLSSTWRLEEDTREQVRREVADFIDVTPNMPGVYRGVEIAAWLHGHYAEVDNYAILDDDSDFLAGQPLFQTTWEHGLTDDIANKVIYWLRTTWGQ